MAHYQLTKKAEADIEGIIEYSIHHFGLMVAQTYTHGLHECMTLLAEHQSWGTDYDFITLGLRRYAYRSHAIYYRHTEDGILVVRVLGAKQDPARHF